MRSYSSHTSLPVHPRSCVTSSALHPISPRSLSPIRHSAIIPQHNLPLIESTMFPKGELPINPSTVIHEGNHPIIVQGRLDDLALDRVHPSSVELNRFHF